MRIQGRHLLKWAVVICSLLLPLTAVAGTLMSQPGSSHCDMSACHCDCCQQQGNRHCRTSHAPCACPSLPALTTTCSGPVVETMVPYQMAMVTPVASLFIFSIYHPPKNNLLFSS